MLPKIIVVGTYEREALLSSLGLTTAKTLGYEGGEGKIDDLRRFINFGMNVSEGNESMGLIVWDADKLSPECQAVLLKPLESVSDTMYIYLVASNENGLLPTIISRCLIDYHTELETKNNSYWKEILDCFSKGPSRCLALADEMEKTEMEVALEEMINKLKLGLESSVNKNRLKVLKLSIDCLANLKHTNVNAKLAFGNFLISSWRLVKS